HNSLDIIIILDRNGFMTYETPSLESILGYQPGYLIGKSPFELIHPADLERVANALNEVYLKTNPGIPTEFRFRKADGTWVYLEAIGQNLLEDLAVNGIVITARDITERKRTEHLLEVSQKKFTAAFQSSPAPMVITDPSNGRIVDVNSACESWSGYRRDEAIGKTTVEIGILSVDQREELYREINGKGKTDFLEMTYHTKDGETRNILHSARFIEIDNEPFLLSHIHDITEQRKAEEELKSHRDHLEDLVKERTTKLIQANERLKQEIEERKRVEDSLRANEEIFRIHFSLSNDV